MTLIPFPDEDKRTARLHEAIANDLEFAERIYRVWLTMSKWPGRPRTVQRLFDVAMMLNLQSCRLFRSIVEEARRAEGMSAIILCRSLFESTMALQFVLSRHVRIMVLPVMDGASQKVIDGKKVYRVSTSKDLLKLKKKEYPSPELRSELYLAHSAFNDPRNLTRMSKIRGVKRASKSAMRKIKPDVALTAEAMIGEGWSYVLQDTESYSGLNIADLARVLGKSTERWYRTIYKMQCHTTHGADGIRHARIVNGQVGPEYFSDEVDISIILTTATLLLLVCMKVCEEYFDFGIINRTMINGLAKEHQRRAKGPLPK